MEVLIDILLNLGGLIGGVWRWFLDLFESQAFSNVFSALLGAVVGSVSGYVFNRQLENTRTKERYLIQRKNVIYSPIYKELLALRAYLKEVEEHTKGFQINIEFDDRNQWSRSFNFHIWEDIKKDIRKTYVTDVQRIGLDELTAKIKNQLALQDTIRKDILKLGKKFKLDNVSEEKPVPDKYASKPEEKVANVLWDILTSHSSLRKAKSELIEYFPGVYTFSESDRETIATKVIAKARRLNSYRSLKPNLRSLIETTDEVLELFDRTISGIIKKYEGGLKIE